MYVIVYSSQMCRLMFVTSVTWGTCVWWWMVVICELNIHNMHTESRQCRSFRHICGSGWHNFVIFNKTCSHRRETQRAMDKVMIWTIQCNVLFATVWPMTVHRRLIIYISNINNFSARSSYKHAVPSNLLQLLCVLFVLCESQSLTGANVVL